MLVGKDAAGFAPAFKAKNLLSGSRLISFLQIPYQLEASHWTRTDHHRISLGSPLRPLVPSCAIHAKLQRRFRFPFRREWLSPSPLLEIRLHVDVTLSQSAAAAPLAKPEQSRTELSLKI